MEHLHDLVLWRFLEGELDEEETLAVEAHLDACGECQELMIRLVESDEDFPLEMPSLGFADRVFEQVSEQVAEAREELAAVEQDTPNVIPLQPRRKPPRLEFITRTLTAAVVTGFMVLGSAQVESLPFHGVLLKFGETGNAVTYGTERVYTELETLFQDMNSRIFE